MIKKIYIDPCHSNIDPGAVGYVVERDLNEKVSNMIQNLMSEIDALRQEVKTLHDMIQGR